VTSTFTVQVQCTTYTETVHLFSVQCTAFIETVHLFSVQCTTYIETVHLFSVQCTTYIKTVHLFSVRTELFMCDVMMLMNSNNWNRDWFDMLSIKIRIYRLKFAFQINRECYYVITRSLPLNAFSWKLLTNLCLNICHDNS